MAEAHQRAIRRTVSIDGVETVYFEYLGAKADAPPIVMLHGYRGNHRGLEGIAGALPEYRIIIPDLPGYGESEQFQVLHTIDNYALWLGKFLNALDITETAFLLGHSFGTLISGNYASKNFCRALILINPVSTPALEGPSALATRGSQAFYELAARLPEQVGLAMIRQWVIVMLMSTKLAKTRDKELRRWIHREHLETFGILASRRVAIEGFRTSLVSNLSPFAPLIEAPVLVIAGELDEITAIATQREAVKTYRNAELREIKNVGHLLHYEAPEVAAEYIREFVEKTSG